MRVATNGPGARKRSATSAGGFSLLELMVALTLGLVVIGAVVATFVSVHSASKDTAGIAQLADDGRIALDILQQTVRTAGYMTCNSTLRQAVTYPGPSPTTLSEDWDEALAGYEAAPGGQPTNPGSTLTLLSNPPGDSSTGDWITSPGLGNALDSSAVATPSALPIAGSDIIAVHTSYSQVAPVYTTADSGANASSVSVQSIAGLASGQLVVVSDCTKSTVDQIASVGGSSVSFVEPLNSQSSFDAGSQVGVPDTIVFYIGTGADGDGALYSYSLAGNPAFQTPTEVAPDVENMQILYGVDTTGGLAATEYVTADQVPAAAAGSSDCPPVTGTVVDFNCVISVRIALLVASPLNATPAPKTARTYNLLGTLVTAPIDTRLRQVFETTVSLRDNTY